MIRGTYCDTFRATVGVALFSRNVSGRFVSSGKDPPVSPIVFQVHLI